MKTIIKTLLALSLVIAFTGCEGDRYDLQTMATEAYHKVLSFQDDQNQYITVYDAGVPVTLTYKVLKGGSDPQAPCSMEVVPMSQEELNTVNSSYTAVPRSYYNVDGTYHFEPGDPAKDVSVTFSAEGIKKMKSYSDDIAQDGKELVLGLKIESDDATVSSGSSVIYLRMNISEVMFKHEIVGADNAMNNLIGFDDLDKCSLFDLPKIKFTLLGTDNEWNSTFTVKYRKDLVEEYNKANNTSYSALDEGVITFESENVELPAGQNDTYISLVKGAGDIPDVTALYLFPVEVVNTNFSTDLETSADDKLHNNIYYMVLSSEVSLSLNDLYSPCTATGHGGSDGQGLSALIDNNLVDNFWSSNWDNSYQSTDWHHFIQVHFTEPLTDAIRIQYWSRDYYKPNPTQIQIYVTDKTSVEERDPKDGWVLLCDVNMTDDGLPVDVFDTWSTKSFDFSEIPDLNGKSVTYMRFCMVTTRDNNDNVPKEVGFGSSSASITELKVWGK